MRLECKSGALLWERMLQENPILSMHFRFLRDVAKQGGGLQTAVRVRGGITKIRCLAAREQSNVKLAIELSESDSRELCWHYELNFKHTGGGIRENQVKIVSEKVFSGRETALCTGSFG